MPPVPSKTGEELSPLQQFVETWKGGCDSSLCHKAFNKCLFKGTIPCDVLFIGSAPGMSEDSTGVPFIGPAGMLLDDIVEQATIGIELCDYCQRFMGPEGCVGCQGAEGHPVATAYTNLVCCIPRYDGMLKEGEAEEDDVLCCKPRLEEFIELCDPVMIVCVGKPAWTRVGVRRHKEAVALPDEDIMILQMLHPSAILQGPAASKELSKRRCVVNLASALEML